VTSPYSTSLLQQPATAAAGPAPQVPAHTRHVTHVVAQPQPMYVPVAAPAPAPAAPRGGGITAVALALVVILVGAIALIGAYYATTQASPTAREAAVVQNTVARDAFRDGRSRGIAQGRGDAMSFSSTTSAMRASIARQNAYNSAYNRGFKAGKNSYHAPRYSGGGYGYRGPRFGGFGGYEVAGALGQAQNMANLTGAPVDVEIY
jgi:hypothetical protein